MCQPARSSWGCPREWRAVSYRTGRRRRIVRPRPRRKSPRPRPTAARMSSRPTSLKAQRGRYEIVDSGSSGSIGALSLLMATPKHSFSGYDWALIIGLFVVLLIAAAAAAAETALTSISHIRMRNLAEEGDIKAQRIRRILEHPDA